jgi:hypothetical protein
MREIRALAATGILGSGFKIESFEKGLSWKPDFIGCDAGTTDFGPYFLGSGESHFSEEAVRRDLRLILLGAQKNGIPALIGSVGTSGANIQLERTIRILKEIATAENLHFRLGVIFSEIEKEYLLNMLKLGRCEPLRNAPPLTEKTIKRSARIVGLAGAEPFIECLDNGCDVIVAGRSSDTSIYAALPIKMGFPPGPVWHAAKILECGAACVDQRKYPDCMFASIDERGFRIEPPNPDFQCTPVSVASHMLYENASSYKIVEPSGTLDARKATYQPLNPRSVRVAGSLFEPAEKYTIKIEGVQLTGYQSIIIGGVRDPVILRQLDSWLEGMQQKIHDRIQSIYGETIKENYNLLFRVYGRNAVMAELEPILDVGHEVGLLIEILADTEVLARSIASAAGHIALHHPVPEWSGLITGLALPHSPAEIFKGAMYEFNMNHIVQPDTYKDIFSIEYYNI